MTWQLLVGLSILLFSVNGLLHRVLMKNDKSDPYVQSIVFSGLAGLFGLVILLLRGGTHSIPSLNQLPSFALITVATAAGSVFAFKGFKFIEASEHTILLTSAKVWSFIGAVVILGEAFTLHKLFGAAIIISGVLIAEWRKSKFVFNLGAIYVLIAAVSYAIGEVFSFYVLRGFDSVSFLVWCSLFTSTLLILLHPSALTKLSFYARPKNLANILTVSLNDTLASIFLFNAYQLGRNATQIGPLMATQTIVTVILALIILRETDHLPQKFIGATLAVLGAILIL